MNSNNIYKIDCHTHPLSHSYYPGYHTRRELTNSDKRNIESMIKQGIERKLDAIAITDHNICTSGFYGKEYVEKNNLPILVLPGCECSVFFENTEIHILALGIIEPFDLTKEDDISRVIDSIHIAGGIAILAHPHYYSDLYPVLKEYVDGFEYYNGVNAVIYPGNEYFNLFNADEDACIKTWGSDYHMTNMLLEEQRNAVVKISKENAPALWKRIRRVELIGLARREEG